MGKYTVHLVGESHYQGAISRLRVGSPIKLTPEPTNPHDPRAIKAHTPDGQTVGYVERDSWLTRAMLDENTQVASRVLEIIGGRPGEMRGVVLDLRTAQDAVDALAGKVSSIQESEAQAMARDAGSWLQRRGGCFWGAAIVVGIIFVAALMPGKPSSTPQAATGADDVVASQAAVEAADAAEEGGPQLTAAQRNAARSASQYLRMSGFSRKGLIQQLSSDAGEGYELADATAAVDSLVVDWDEQAVRSARQYLSTSGFSCKGLIQQLSSSAGEDFTAKQAAHGAKEAGAC